MIQPIGSREERIRRARSSAGSRIYPSALIIFLCPEVIQTNTTLGYYKISADSSPTGGLNRHFFKPTPWKKKLESGAAFLANYPRKQCTEPSRGDAAAAQFGLTDQVDQHNPDESGRGPSRFTSENALDRSQLIFTAVTAKKLQSRQ